MNNNDREASANSPGLAQRFRDRLRGRGGVDHAGSAQQTATLRSLGRTLESVDHELRLLSHASKYNWINQRLILLRNALIAVSVLVIVVIAAVACYREAYRQTLTIAAFDVPPKLAERGITGQVIAKALFDELIKRRELVTTLETGELKGAWAENRADVAIPEAKFTVQSVFRYLRYMTGNEISVDGEFILDGDDVTMKVRVAGKPPTVVKGKLAEWEMLTGDLANGVLEVTQPAVLMAYLGLQAKTPGDLAALSKRIFAMRVSAQLVANPVLSVAYDAYGSALQRQGKLPEARAAFGEAMALDASNGVAVINLANLENSLRNYSVSSSLYERAQGLRLPDGVKAIALARRIAGAGNTGDCSAWAAALADAKASSVYRPAIFSRAEALYVARCEYEEARGVEIIERLARLHPETADAVNALGALHLNRPEGRYVQEAIAIYQRAIASGTEDQFVYSNLFRALAESGEFEEARKVLELAREDGRRRGLPAFPAGGPEGQLAYLKGDFALADAWMKKRYAVEPLRERRQFLDLAAIKIGLQRFDEAEKIYNDGLALMPKSCDLWEGFGSLHAKKGDVATALTTYDKGIAAVPKCGLNYNSAARLLIKQNRIPEAKQKLDTLIKIAPNSDGAVIAKEILAGLPK